MKLHTALNYAEVVDALNRTKAAGHMTSDIFFYQDTYQASRTHRYGFHIQLGTYDQRSGPTYSRHYKNTGHYGAQSAWLGYPVWAATYDEWGYFIEEIFEADITARFGHYRNYADFCAKTDNKYRKTCSCGEAWANKPGHREHGETDNAAEDLELVGASRSFADSDIPDGALNRALPPNQVEDAVFGSLYR
jgi:hypothetical protein